MTITNERSALFAPRVTWNESELPSNEETQPQAFLNPKMHFPEVIGNSEILLKVLADASRMAQSEGSVLITGESGTGKELIAKAMHRLSERRLKKFVAINCSAIPEDLLESELFGHEKGAFTGAISRRAGLFEQAHGGSLFLDEIGEMPLRLQAKLLRVLQEKRFTAVGGNELKNADVRIIAATNINLQDAVESKTFRLDLFYRLNVLPIHLPPLRERGTDVIELANFFLKLQAEVHNLREDCTFSRDVLVQMLGYPWPGNIRELQNLIERLVVIKRGGRIELSDLPREFIAVNLPTFDRKQLEVPLGITDTRLTQSLFDKMNPQVENSRALDRTPFGELERSFDSQFPSLPESGIDLCVYIQNLENHFIRTALARTDNNKNQAAKLLGLNRTTLVERLKKRHL